MHETHTRHGTSHGRSDANSYACPMHPAVTAEGPGRCSECGMQGDGGMSSCLLAGGRIMLCALSTVNQIGLWEEMFGAVLPFTGALLIPVTTLLAIGGVVLGTLRTGSNPSAVSRRFLQRFPDWRPLEHLREAFSQGILHPKIYESASY